jgi:type II secretory pathway predicted ATPase ExeA
MTSVATREANTAGPLELKNILAKGGVEQAELARRLTNPKTGRPLSKAGLSAVVNQGVFPKRFPEFKKQVEAEMKRLGLPTEGVWKPAKSNGQGAKEKEVEIVNVPKVSLDSRTLQHFGLADDPFAEPEDFRRVWLSGPLEALSNTLAGAVRKRRLVALWGDVGSGKSTVLRYTLSRLYEDHKVKLIFPNCMDRKRFDGEVIISEILRDQQVRAHHLGLAERNFAAVSALERMVQDGVSTALIIDEAHDMTARAIVDLKRLWDSAALFKLLAIVLVGQGGETKDGKSWGLKHLLMHTSEVREFTERTTVLGMPRTQNGQLRSYLEWRFKEAAGELDRVFEPAAVAALGQRTNSLQLANNLAALAMIVCVQNGQPRVTAEMVARV